MTWLEACVAPGDPALPEMACGPQSANRPLHRVVHVSSDFPDPIDPAKTPVIRRLVELTERNFAHRVVSLNRHTPGWGELHKLGAPPHAEPFDLGEALAYHAPPHGLLHATLLNRLGDWLARRLAPAPPALLIGHKLTIEGLVAARAAARLGLPYAITIQGNSDCRILHARPDLRPRLGRIFHGAAEVFAFAPWAIDRVERVLGHRSGPVSLLPCPTDLDQPLAPDLAGNGLVSVFHLRHHRIKNLAGLVAGWDCLQRAGTQVPLEIIGGGSEGDRQACRAIIGGREGIALAGAMDRPALRQRLNRASGLVLPSLRESFGLVFIEALFAGVPVIYPRGAAIDGWFDGTPFAIAVDARDPAELGSAMARLLREEVALKAALRQWQGSAEAQRFQRAGIGAAFAAGLGRALAARVPGGALQEGRTGC